MDIWTKIDALKKAKEWTDFDVAKAIGKTSKSYLYNIRTGVSQASPQAARDLADVLVGEKLLDRSEVNAFLLAFLYHDPASPRESEPAPEAEPATSAA